MRGLWLTGQAIIVVLGTQAALAAAPPRGPINLVCRWEATDGASGTELLVVDPSQYMLDGHRNGERWTAGRDLVDFKEYALAARPGMIRRTETTHANGRAWASGALEFNTVSLDYQDTSLDPDGNVTRFASGQCKPWK